MKTLASHAQQQNRQFNPAPAIGGKTVDLFNLWTLVAQSGGSSMVERNGQWQQIANRMGFPEPQFPTASLELRQCHSRDISQYERLWVARLAQQKQEVARMHASQMAGMGGPPQASPTRQMQGTNQPNPYFQPPQQNQAQAQAQSTPVAANAQLPQNGMITPQQQQMLQHRRSSSVRRPDQPTPQPGAPVVAAPSPHTADKGASRLPLPGSQDGRTRMMMKSEEDPSTVWMPRRSTTQRYGGYELDSSEITYREIADLKPFAPTVNEMGVIDVKAITLSLASGIHSEVRYALDALCTISSDARIMFDLSQSEDLFDVIIDCAEVQVDSLSNEAAEVSDALDLTPYEDVVRAARIEADTLQDVPEFGTQAYDLERAAERLVAISTILRNLSFYEPNHTALTSPVLVKWFSNAIRLLGTRNMLLRSYSNIQDFYKDMIILLSNITQRLELPSRDDALHILHFLLAFAPQPAPSYMDTKGKLRFASYSPAAHCYLPPAVDSLAKLLARQDPNRMFYRSIFTSSSSSLAASESPLDLLTRAFALSIAVLPDRTRVLPGPDASALICGVRIPYVSQGMLAADILAALIPANDSELARKWLESEDGWAVGLLDLASMLAVETTVLGQRARDASYDHESHKILGKLSSQHALAMLQRLAEKARKGRQTQTGRAVSTKASEGLANGDAVVDGGEVDGKEKEEQSLAYEAFPFSHKVLGALMKQDTDKVALGLMCGLHELTMQAGA